MLFVSCFARAMLYATCPEDTFWRKPHCAHVYNHKVHSMFTGNVYFATLIVRQYRIPIFPPHTYTRYGKSGILH